MEAEESGAPFVCCDRWQIPIGHQDLTREALQLGVESGEMEYKEVFILYSTLVRGFGTRSDHLTCDFLPL